MTRTWSILLPLLGTVACSSSTSQSSHVADLIARDSIVYSAVVDSMMAGAQGLYTVRFAVEPVDTSSSDYLGPRVAELREALPGIIAARRAILVARGVPVLEFGVGSNMEDVLRAGCPRAFSNEPMGPDCPAEQEIRVVAGWVREASDTTQYHNAIDLAEGEASIGVWEMSAGPGGASSASAEWILVSVDGRWRADRRLGYYDQ